jgi:hypothetical protein
MGGMGGAKGPFDITMILSEPEAGTHRGDDYLWVARRGVDED